MLGFDLSNSFRSVENEAFLDYLYYNLPKEPNNLTKYIFPSMYIWYEGRFKTLRFLQKYREDPTNFSLLKILNEE